MNVPIQVSLWACFHFSWVFILRVHTPGAESLGHMVTLFNLLQRHFALPSVEYMRTPLSLNTEYFYFLAPQNGEVHG